MQTVDTTTTRPQQQPQQPDFAPPQAPPPPPPGKSRKGLIVGLLAALGVLGFLALLAVGALILFFAIGSTTSSGEQPADQPADRPVAPQPAAEDDQQQQQQQPVGEPISADGSLDGLVQERGGDFALQHSEALAWVEDAGGTEGRELLYASPAEGVEVVHWLTDWDSPAAADRIFRAQAEYFASEGYEQAEQFEVTGQEGERLGSGVALVGSDGEEVVLWTNNDGFYAVFAPEGYGMNFYENLAY